MSIQKDEQFAMRTPPDNIKCKTCSHRLPTVTVRGKDFPRHTFAACAAYADKPRAVLWSGADCELYKQEKG